MRKLFIIFTILLSVLLLNGCNSISVEQSDTAQTSGSVAEGEDSNPRLVDETPFEEELPKEPMDAVELMDNPIYGEDVILKGKVSMLGELFCPCFQLGEGDDYVEVWYDLMAVDSDEPWPKVNVDNIKNGDEVKVTGQLRKNTGSLPSRTVWLKSIEKID